MRPIASSLSPNVQKDDVFLALKMLFSPWSFYSKNYIKALEQWFRQYFSASYAVSFNSGRSALLSVLRAIGVAKNDEVILQSFTCVVVPNAVIALGAKPVYCDITDKLTIDPKEFETKISKKTKAVIVQHTFGIPSHIKEIKKIANKYNLFIIEDCAHVIGQEYKQKKLGTFGDATIFSFGRDKAFSSVFGGMALTDSDNLGKKIRFIQKNMPDSDIFWTYQQLFHPLAFFIILPFYNFFSFGKILLVLMQKLKLLSFPVFPEEKEGLMRKAFLKKMSNALACLALAQLKKIDIYNRKRKEFSRLYLDSLRETRYILPYKDAICFLRFPIIVERREECLNYLRSRGIYAGTWYSNIVDPKNVNFEKIYYKRGLCPNAEYIADKIINLPTYPTMREEELKRVIKALLAYDKNTRGKR